MPAYEIGGRALLTAKAAMARALAFAESTATALT
jgi:hypothetical protein